MRLKHLSNVLKKLFIGIFASTFFVSSASSQQTDPVLVQSEILYRQGKYEQAIQILADRLKIAEQKKETKLKTIIYNSIGKSYSQLGKSIEALKNYQTAARMADEQNDQASLGKIEENIGALYEEQKNFGQALIHYQKAEVIAREIKDESLLADIYNNTGIIYEQQLKYPLALENYQKALQVYQKLKKTDRIALSLNNMGIVYKFLGNYSKALSFYTQSLKYSELLGDNFLIAANLNNIGNVYAMLKDYPQAIRYNTKSLALARSIGATNIIVEALSSLADDYAGKGDFKNAYRWNQQFIKVNNDYINLESSKKLAELQTLYQTEKQNRQIDHLKQNGQINALKLKAQALLIQRQNYQLFFISIILIISLGLGYSLYHIQQIKQLKKHAEAIRQTQNQERSRIAKDMHDDIGSGLSKITLMAASATARLQNHTLESSEITNIARVSKDLVENMRDLIWVLNPENATLDNLTSRIREYCSDYLETCAVAAEIDIQDEIPCLKISQQVQRNLFLTLKEALHNCIKHADCNSVSIKLTYTNQLLTIIIADNGKGFDINHLKGKGNGLRNMKYRITAIGGEFESLSHLEAGTTTIIKITQEKLQNTLPV
ncbi:tetratricopeptide repeat protein [Pedobacter sp. BS3]|uniref:tetratricopeptide repeat-containing sensor histidine kinase n=1 Tax=Pedobacter sp. BS3 TaxID=2567937 RepID=UPI0011EDC0A2|nr:tetratricopeptide repeat-containing sensor histidine kinase [Pedobacter sp. BS3]TZF84069.1 tetratricopeptide repeat protein [Pedobacter sp. BS3]